MEIAVVGPLEFTLGFQLAGVKNLHNPNNDQELSELLKSLLNQKEIGVVVVDNIDLNKLSDRLRIQLTESVTPTCLLYTSPSPRDRTRSRMPSSA